jgi:deoxyribose-phosphate aldolase
MDRAPAPGSRHSPLVRIADVIDHTLLKAEATAGEIDRLCAEAKEHRFAAVCVNGVWTARCAAALRGSGVKVATVVGFPLGAGPSAAKAGETRQVVSDGADEIDMVAAIGHIVDQDWDHVEGDIRAVVEAAAGRTVKVILETAALEPLTIVKAAALAREAGAGFVKTSTGFHPAGGATPEAVALLRLAVGDGVGVKAAGGVRDCAAALRMIAAGATRLGTSSGTKLVACLGRGPLPLADLLAAPEKHESGCQTGACESY